MPDDVKWWRPKSAPFVYASSVPRWLDRTKAYPGVVLTKRPGVVRLFRDLDALAKETGSLCHEMPRMLLLEVEVPREG